MNQEEMAVKLTEVDARSKSNTHRINELSGQFEALNRLATAMEVMAAKQDNQAEKIDEMKESVNRLDEKVEAIEKKPTKRWDTLMEKIFFGLVGALVTALGAGIVYLLAVAA